MIRSRDVILFVLVVWVLLLAISVTVWNDTSSSSGQDLLQSFWEAPSPEVESGATVGETASPAVDRDATIARLREKLAAETEVSNAVPSVEISAPPETASEEEAGPQAVQRCAYPDDSLGYISSWPVQAIEVEMREGARLYYEETTVTQPVVHASGTTAQAETVRTTWLQLPQFPQPLATPACVPSEAIGVHTNGTLLFNVDAAAYRNLDANTLIGYARDGFPVYGLYDGEVDSCGGYQHPSGYRYVIQPDVDSFIQCFRAAPQAFNW